MSGCVFYMSWQGECGAVTPSDSQFCNEHRGTDCVVCGEQASCECGSAGSLVCGKPLCQSCACPSHGSTGHGADRHLDIESDSDEDIVASVLDNGPKRRIASGNVDGNRIRLKKYRAENSEAEWRVRVRNLSTGDTSYAEFDSNDYANQHFDGLVEKYEIQEAQ
jgi:hypothetical protein